MRGFIGGCTSPFGRPECAPPFSPLCVSPSRCCVLCAMFLSRYVLLFFAPQPANTFWGNEDAAERASVVVIFLCSFSVRATYFGRSTGRSQRGIFKCGRKVRAVHVRAGRPGADTIQLRVLRFERGTKKQCIDRSTQTCCWARYGQS